MTPEELLRCLLDSREQSAAASGQQATLPTRIRALEALREQVLSVTELADRIGVTRQTAYRALKPGQEAGLIRTLGDGLALSCSGGAILRAYHEVCEEIDRDALVQLGLPSEESRHAILQAKLEDVPHDLTGDQLAILASHTDGCSGADIEELVTDAKRRAARRDARTVSIEDFPTPE